MRRFIILDKNDIEKLAQDMIVRVTGRDAETLVMTETAYERYLEEQNQKSNMFRIPQKDWEEFWD